MSPGAADDPAQVIPESLADLLERPLYAHMATVRPDGTPQVNPTWYRFDGEYVWLTATTYRQKYRNWQHQPATALSSESSPIPRASSSSAWPNATASRRDRPPTRRTASPWRSGRGTPPPNDPSRTSRCPWLPGVHPDLRHGRQGPHYFMIVQPAARARPPRRSRLPQQCNLPEWT